jgi:hypothetical protein
MKRFKKSFNPNLIRINRSFSVPEIAGLLGVNRYTILAWHKKEGLKAIDDRAPYLFHGKELRRFIQERQKERKQKCGPNEFYCFKCRKPRVSLDNRVIIIINNPKQLNIQGTCVLCGSKMNRRNVTKNLPELTEVYCIEEIRDRHILDGLSSIVITNIKGGAGDDRMCERPIDI